METIARFLRYPGSKRRMLSFLTQHLPTAGEIKGCYVEPFVGSGAVFFSVDPVQATLADLNPDLITLLQGVQLAPTKIWDIYCQFGDTKLDYKQVRDLKSLSTLEEKAARVLYLNRTCFKGMWRTNLNGEFNVGYGGQARRWVINENNLIEVSNALKKAVIRCADFEEIVYSLRTSDFLFLDPPYRPGEKEQINSHYMGKTFRFTDHQRLGEALAWAKQHDIHWAMTTSSHSDILQLFEGNYYITIPLGTGRSPGVMTKDSGEVLITSYSIPGGKIL